MDLWQIGVVGAGTMGNGIAHVFARSGYSVVSVRCGAAVSGARDRDDHEES